MKKSQGKRILSALLCACILAGSDGTFVRAASAALGSVSGNEAVVQESEAPDVVTANELTYKPYEDASYELKYTFDTGENNGIMITGYIGTADGELVIPDSIGGVPVVKIGDQAFSSCSGLTSNLVLPDSLTSIGEYAFYNCIGLTGNLVLPDSLTSIGDSAFADCIGFTGNLVLPDSLTSIGDHAFADCIGFTGNLVLPDSLTSIDASAFNGCIGFIGNLVFPDSLTSIGEYAFSGCRDLTGNLVLPDSLTSIGDSAFYGCSGFTGNLVFPDSLTSIGDSAFRNCNGFTGNLVLPDSLTSIGDSAFADCIGLTGNLVLPDSLTSIGDSAFYYCGGLTGNLVLPDSLTSIGNSAFSGCNGFTGNLVLPDSLTSIGDSAFADCRGLIGNLMLPDSLTSIGNSAFSGCNGFTGNLMLPDSLTSIGDGAFWICRGLNGNIIMSDSVTSIGRNAFSLDGSNSITIYAPKGSYGETYAMQNGYTYEDLASEHTYKPYEGASYELKYFIDASEGGISITGYTGTAEGVLAIPDNINGVPVVGIEIIAFADCSGFIGDLVLPDSLTSIGNSAFSGCNGFTGNLVLPDSLTSIGDGAFWICRGLNGNIIMSDSVTSIGRNAFSLDGSNSITIYAPKDSYGETYAMQNGYTYEDLASEHTYKPYEGASYELKYFIDASEGGISITGYTGTAEGVLAIPDNINGVPVVGIEIIAFADCSGFTGDLVLPDSLTSIGDYAFYGCNGLNGNIIMSDSVTSIGTDALFLGDDTPIIIHAPKGSYGEAYALENGYAFENSNSSVTLGDVPQDSWKYEPALYVYKRGVMTGKGFDGDGNVIFAPDEPLTREQFAQVLYSAEGKENLTYTTRFSDVADGQWYTNAVLWAADKGIVSGYADGRYGAGDPITREQLAAMLYKYAQYKGYDISAREAFDRFTDADQVSGWAVNQLQWAVANGVMSGKGETLDPLGSATRAECAAMLRTFLVKFE